MVEQIISFLKKAHRVLIVIFAAVIFFLGYNTYLVDYSLVNLRTTLIKLNNVANLGDAKRLIPLLQDSLLEEVISRELKIKNLSYAELAKDVLDRAKDKARLDDVKFALKEVISQKEKERSAVLVFLDKVFSPLLKAPSKAKLESRVNNLKRRIATARDKRILQDIYYDLAGTYVRLGKFDEAKEAYRKTIELIPETKLTERAQFNLAWNEKFQGNFDEAVKQFETFSQATKEESLAIFSKYQIAEIYKLQGDYERAMAIYREIIARYPNSELAKIAQFQIGSIYLYELKDYNKAEEVFNEINNLYKGSSLSTYVEKRKLKNIAYRYNRIGFSLLREGYGLSIAEKYKQALKYFDQALEILPEDGIACIGKALAYLWLGEADKALGFTRKTRKLQSRNEFITVNACYVYIQLELIDEALAECKRFALLKPKSFLLYYNLGFLYITQNNFKHAVAAFYRSTRLQPKFGPAFNNLGYCLWQLRKYAQAIKAFEQTVDIEPAVLEAHFNLALAYAETGEYKEAEKKFIDALSINPQHFESQVCLREVKRIIREKYILSTINK